MKKENYNNPVLPSPCFLLKMEDLMRNLALIDRVRQEADVEIIVALKACAMWSIFPTLAKHSDGATASSLAEARLVWKHFKANEDDKATLSHTYAPIYVEREIDEILSISSHITFNSLSQYERYGERARGAGVCCGLRINPHYSPVETDIYNPCVAGSRLGISHEMLAELPEGIEGLHFHSLCESRPEHLRLALESVEKYYSHLLPQIKWLNCGGGHLMTHANYDIEELISILKAFKSRHPHLRIILEPGSAFTWRTGVLVTTIEDIVESGGVKTAIIDASFACHMPDTLEMPYKPAILGAHDTQSGEEGWRVGGNSCLAGDYIGEWSFDDGHMPSIGERIIFEDMIHYTMVKTTMFNGVSHPSIAILHVGGEIELIKSFSAEDYEERLS